MGNFFSGLCIMLLGLGLFQFSGMFSLYSANAKDEGKLPWSYLILRSVGISFMLAGLFILILGLV